MTNIAYIRVSSTDQNTARQLAGCPIKFDKTFTDKCSGSTTNRPELTKLVEYARTGDHIYCHQIDRLARNLCDLKNLVTGFNSKGISISFVKENLSFKVDENNMMDNLLLNMMGAFAEFERDMMLSRQAEGIAKAKAEGRYKGGKKRYDKIEILAELERGTSIRKTAERFGCNPSTVQRIRKSA